MHLTKTGKFHHIESWKTVFCAVDIFAVFAYLLIKFATVFSGVEASDMFLICRHGCFGSGKMNCTLVSGVLRIFFFAAPSFKQSQRKKENNINKYSCDSIGYSFYQKSLKLWSNK